MGVDPFSLLRSPYTHTHTTHTHTHTPSLLYTEDMSFSPYSSNGGTVLGVSGEDYAIVASDTRLSEGYSIHSRDHPKTYQLNAKTVLGCAGYHGDVLALIKRIERRMTMYEHAHHKPMSAGHGANAGHHAVRQT